MRQNNSQLRDIIQWTLFALIAAEEFGITSENIDRIYKNSDHVFIRRFLGIEGTLGKKLGLKNDWAYQVIRSIGNYGEVFERHLGDYEYKKRFKCSLDRWWNDICDAF